MHLHLLSLLKERIQHLVAKMSLTFWAFFGRRRQSSLLRIIGFLLFFGNSTLSHLNLDILNGRWCWALQIYALHQKKKALLKQSGVKATKNEKKRDKEEANDVLAKS